MKLIWVPVDANDGGEEEELEEEEEESEEEQTVEEEAEELEEYEEIEIGEVVDSRGHITVEDENEVSKQRRTKFHHSLDVLMAEQHRRRSDPGPHSVLNFAVTRSQSPPVPPKQAQSDHKPPQDEEENIYEVTLPLLKPPVRKTSPVCKELDIPLIKVRKPARRSKLSYSTSDPTSEFQSNSESSPSLEDGPPAIPPRRPLTQEGRSPTPALRGGIPLPQPTPEEWRALQPSSLSKSSAGGLSPQHAVTPSLNSPVRPPPPPPKTDPRRLSTASLQSLTQKKGLCKSKHCNPWLR